MAVLANSRFDRVVSLGCSCQPAFQIRRLLGIEEAQVFDWLITEDPGIIHLIKNAAEDVFRQNDLKWINGAVRSLTHGTRYMHEFPAEADIEKGFLENTARFATLTRRWRDLMTSDERVLFVRIHAWSEDPPAMAVQLRDTLEAAAPRLRFELLYLTPPELFDPTWSVAGITHRPVAQPEPYTWKGDDAVWERLLSEALAPRQAP